MNWRSFIIIITVSDHFHLIGVGGVVLCEWWHSGGVNAVANGLANGLGYVEAHGLVCGCAR